MESRPKLDRKMKSDIFREYYYLKEELIQFCRENGLPTGGGKMELTNRIVHYLDTGEILKRSELESFGNRKNETSSHNGTDSISYERIRISTPGTITLESIIETDFVCTQKHREFFKKQIGKSFSFKVEFQNWLKSNGGKTYQDAIDAYHRIMEEKKISKTTIDRQFEYNTYIRDFFAANKGRSLEEAIICWKYKKAKRGHNRYETADLCALQLPVDKLKG